MSRRGRLGWTSLVLVAVAAVAVVLTGQLRSPGKLPDDLASALTEAKNANAGHDIELQRRILEHAEILDGDRKDAAEVQRLLAALEWRYHLQYEDARARLVRATLGAKPADAWLALAELEQHLEDHPAAREAARNALAAATMETERRSARVTSARASVAEAAALRRSGKVAATAELRAAFEDMRDLVEDSPGLLDPSLLLLRAALLLDEGDAALLAWRSYFHVAPGGSGPNAVARAGGSSHGSCRAGRARRQAPGTASI